MNKIVLKVVYHFELGWKWLKYCFIQVNSDGLVFFEGTIHVSFQKKKRKKEKKQFPEVMVMFFFCFFLFVFFFVKGKAGLGWLTRRQHKD